MKPIFAIACLILSGCISQEESDRRAQERVEAASQQCAMRGMDTGLVVNKYGAVVSVVCTARPKEKN